MRASNEKLCVNSQIANLFGLAQGKNQARMSLNGDAERGRIGSLFKTI
jgi:hypothetical protein